jgi:hypothetical protein
MEGIIFFLSNYGRLKRRNRGDFFMELDFSSILFSAFSDVLWSGIRQYLVPFIVWISIPSIVANMLFKNKEAGSLGALLGFVGLFTIGPFSN